MNTWDLLADLPLTIESIDSEAHTLPTTMAWARWTTEFRLHGAGLTGRGEDVNYAEADHKPVPQIVAQLPVAGTWTLGSLSAHLDTLDLFPTGPASMPGMEPYRRWAIESAALDLALQQAGTTLASAVGREARPVHFCLSMGPGSPPSLEKVTGWLAADPQVRFKIDASKEWTDEIAAQLAATDAVDVIDIKGHYTGDWIDNSPDAELYERIARHFPGAYLEDAMLTEETTAALDAHGALDRLTWDAPIHEVGDVTSLTHRPAAVNIKPSRFGTIKRLLDTIDHCNAEGLPLYGGGQFELGVGRRHIQRVASVWYADASNDVAPVEYHAASPGDPVPSSPLELEDTPGF